MSVYIYLSTNGVIIHLLRFPRLVIVCSSDAKTRQCRLDSHCNQPSSLINNQLSLAISSRCKISRAIPSCALILPTFFWLQDWRARASLLSLIEIRWRGQLVVTGVDQDCSTASWKPSSLVQKLLKWNLFLPWIPSLRPSKRGQWSDISVAWLCKMHYGYNAYQSAVQRTRSNLTRVGASVSAYPNLLGTKGYVVVVVGASVSLDQV
jgi:hypothetical protein